MYLPSLHPISKSHFYVSGSVTIDPSAAIAPGVLLQADPESQIIIAAGACVGMGAVLHANQGIIEVEEGANIGTGVLIIGRVKIGTNACVGSMTTILNSSIERGELVPPGSLIGDASRQVDKAQRPEATTTIASESFSNQQPLPENQPAATTTPASEPASNQQAPDLDVSRNQVYGQANLNRLLSTLLPHRKALNRPLQDDQPSSNSS